MLHMVLLHSRQFSLQHTEKNFLGEIALKNIIKASQVIPIRFHTFDPRQSTNARPQKTYCHDNGTKKKV